MLFRSQTLAPYLNCVRHTLTSALCLQNFGSQLVERHNKPEVEAKDHCDADGKMKMTSKELMLQSIRIARNEGEAVLIEGSINSIRVSVKVKQADEQEVVLCRRFMRFLGQRAEQFVVLRRVPVPGYDISFLITNHHIEDMYKHKVVDFIISFMEGIDAEISSSKLAVSARARYSARVFLESTVKGPQ